MTAFVVVAATVLGLLVGSFVNVVVWRVPRGESVVRPGSHCPSCGAPIGARDNLPVVSWLLLRGRCRHCGQRIRARYPLVELATAVLFGALAWRIGADAPLPAYLWLGAVCIALTLIDLDVRRLPDAITLPSYPVLLALLGAAAAVDGEWGRLLRAVLGMVVLYAFYFGLRLAYPRGMGGGDVKLAGVLGLALGWLGWGEVAVGAFLGFLVGGLYGIALMARGKAGRKSAIPFGPFMVVGALLAVFVGGALADLYLDVALR